MVVYVIGIGIIIGNMVVVMVVLARVRLVLFLVLAMMAMMVMMIVVMVMTRLILGVLSVKTMVLETAPRFYFRRLSVQLAPLVSSLKAGCLKQGERLPLRHCSLDLALGYQ